VHGFLEWGECVVPALAGDWLIRSSDRRQDFVSGSSTVVRRVGCGSRSELLPFQVSLLHVLDDNASGDDPIEDAGKDVVATDEHEVVEGPHVADRDH
jgi:hypothetical protein